MGREVRRNRSEGREVPPPESQGEARRTMQDMEARREGMVLAGMGADVQPELVRLLFRGLFNLVRLFVLGVWLVARLIAWWPIRLALRRIRQSKRQA